MLSNPAFATLELCSAYLAAGEMAAKVSTAGGSLERILKRTAQQNVPVGYTLQSLGFTADGQPLKQHGAKIVSEFNWDASTAAEVTLNPESISAYSGGLPSILVVEKGRDMDWYFMNSGKYHVESYSPIGIAAGSSAEFDHVIMPEIWQTLNASERSQLLQGAYQTLRPGGSLRFTVRIQDVDQLAPELNGLLEDVGARGLFDSMKKQVDLALGSRPYKMLARIQKVSFEPTQEDTLSETFNEGLGPTMQGTQINSLAVVRRPSMQALIVVRKPGNGWGEWILGQ